MAFVDIDSIINAKRVLLDDTGRNFKIQLQAIEKRKRTVLGGILGLSGLVSIVGAAGSLATNPAYLIFVLSIVTLIVCLGISFYREAEREGHRIVLLSERERLPLRRQLEILVTFV